MYPDPTGPAADHGGDRCARHPRPRAGAVRRAWPLPAHRVSRPLLLSSGVLIPALLCACGDPDRAPGAAASRTASSEASAAAAIEVVDGAGRTVRLERPARRVVSMMPAVTEWLLAMGAAERLVARTDYDTDPSLARLPTVGGGLDPSVEWLAARRPDLVLAWPDAPSRSLVTRLEGLGVPVYTAPIQSIEDALDVARDLGRLLGDTGAADAAIAEVRRGLDSVRAAVADRPRPSVLFLIGLDPLMAAGPGTFLHELVEWAGGQNVIEDIGILWPQLSLEEVVRRAPDVVIVGSIGLTDPVRTLAGRPGWRELDAVRAGRVHSVHPDTVNRPGPGLDEAAALLARILHPSAAVPGDRP